MSVEPAMNPLEEAHDTKHIDIYGFDFNMILYLEKDTGTVITYTTCIYYYKLYNETMIFS